MKITKKQLQRIIKEEHTKILKEIDDTAHLKKMKRRLETKKERTPFEEKSLKRINAELARREQN